MYPAIVARFDKSTTDGFFLALTLPWLVVAPVMNAVGSVLVPVLVDVRTRDPGQFLPTLRGVLTLSLLLAGGFCGLAWLATLPIESGIESLAVPTDAADVTDIVFQLMPLMFLQILTSLLDAVANARRKIWLPATGNLARQVATFVVIVLADQGARPEVLPISFTIGAIAHLTVCVAGMPGSVRYLVPTLELAPTVRKVATLSVSTLLGTFFLQLGAVGSRIIAGFVGPGAITAYDLAVRAYQAVIELVSSAFLAATLTNWSRRHALGDTGGIGERLRLASAAALLISTPVVVILAALATPVISLWLGHRGGGPSMVPVVATVLIALLAAAPLDFVSRIYVRAFLATQDTAILGWQPAVRIALSLASAGILVDELGLLAVGLGELVGVATSLLMLGLAARRHVGSSLVSTSLNAVKLVPVAAATYLAAQIAFNALVNDVNSIAGVGIGTAAGLTTYIIVSYAFGFRLPLTILGVGSK